MVDSVASKVRKRGIAHAGIVEVRMRDNVRSHPRYQKIMEALE